MGRFNFLVMLPLLVLALVASTSAAPEGKDREKEKEQEPEPVAVRPQVPGKLRLHLRQRQPAEGGRFRVVHYCKGAAQRVKVMVPRMNEVLTAARSHGVMIIHAPSGTMDVYAGTPHRKRMQQARQTKPPVPIAGWCHLDPKREPPLPVDTSKCSCDDPVLWGVPPLRPQEL